MLKDFKVWSAYDENLTNYFCKILSFYRSLLHKFAAITRGKIWTDCNLFKKC